MHPYIWIALIIFILLILYAIWRYHRRRRFIQNYVFPQAAIHNFQKEYPQLSQEQIEEVQQGLKDYFLIHLADGGKKTIMPSKVVDALWHQFILCTRDYHHFCRQAFGHYFHHYPAEIRPLTAADLKRTWRLACHLQNIDPKKPKQVPRLFALDLQLGIAGGYYYTLDSLTAEIAEEASAVIEVSSIDCSGGDCGGGDCGGGCGGD